MKSKYLSTPFVSLFSWDGSSHVIPSNFPQSPTPEGWDYKCGSTTSSFKFFMKLKPFGLRIKSPCFIVLKSELMRQERLSNKPSSTLSSSEDSWSREETPPSHLLTPSVTSVFWCQEPNIDSISKCSEYFGRSK